MSQGTKTPILSGVVTLLVLVLLAPMTIVVLVLAVDAEATHCNGVGAPAGPVGEGTPVPDTGGGSFPLPKADLSKRDHSDHPCLADAKTGKGKCSIPADYLAAYLAAGRRHGVPWQLLAGIGYAETKHGSFKGPGVRSGENSAGARGPMQFLPGTWDQYGVDGDRDGIKNPYDIADAAFATARHLTARGGVRAGPEGVRWALLRYNGGGGHPRSSHPSIGYMNDVLAYAWDYAEGGILAVRGSPSGQCVPDTGSKPSPCMKQDTPRTQSLRRQIEVRFGGMYETIGGYRAGDPQDHGCGKALDIMVSKIGTRADGRRAANGYDIAAWAQRNARQLGVHYIIYRQCIWNVERTSESGCGNMPASVGAAGWRAMENRGSITQNHFDHVHISVY